MTTTIRVALNVDPVRGDYQGMHLFATQVRKILAHDAVRQVLQGLPSPALLRIEERLDHYESVIESHSQRQVLPPLQCRKVRVLTLFAHLIPFRALPEFSCLRVRKTRRLPLPAVVTGNATTNSIAFGVAQGMR
ncbi:hypothetical protein [Candidatus Accumulibacter aalborgensis]|uniref:hypothetical protein n=1 Tax=Candidatus Accumulibacter aalborgensis TaxID=1860102 RepID=UPI001649483E|nr:hypothetical protein [Candidatus Accumulibacter aalborgensis]